MGIYTEAVQKLYVAYFNRPADAAGLTYWESVVTAAKGDTTAVSAAFAASAEYKATFAGQNEYQIINTIYKNLFGRDAEPAGLNYWGQALLNKTITIDLAVKTISEAALTTDATAYKNKVAAATAFTAALDTTEEILNYSGDAANAAAKVFIAGVTTDATLAAAIAPAALAATVAAVTTPFVAPVTLNLTVGIDTATGGAGNDIINATTSTGANALTTFDAINGGAGIDTLRFVDTGTAVNGQFSIPTGATVTNVEVVSIATVGGANVSTKAMAGVTDLQVSAAGTAAVVLDAANTTNVVLSSATTGTTTVTGGKAVTASLATGAGDVSVIGSGLTTVTINGGAAVIVDNQDSAAVTAKGTTLTSVTLNAITGATAALSGASLTNVSLNAIAQAGTVTVVNGTADHTLNLATAGTGYTAAGAAAPVLVVDAAAATVAVTATGAKSNLALDAAAATKVTVAGAGVVALDLNSATSTKITTVDASAATGAVTLTDMATSIRTVTTGSANDSVAFSALTVKDDTTTVGVDETKNATVSTGAGDDVITLTTSGNGKVTVDAGAGNDTVAVTTRGTEILDVNLGDGNDTFTAAVAVNGTDIINAGAGVDTLTLSLVGSANIGAFAGFDIFDTTGLARTLDVDILATKNTVAEFIAAGNVGAGAALINVGAGVGVRATADMAGSTLAVTQKTAGALTVTVDADETGKSDDTIDTVTASINATNATAVKAVFDTAYLANVATETKLGDNVTTLAATSATAASLEIVSGGTGSNNVLTYNDSANKLASVTVTGEQALNLSVTTTKLATVDASAHTGGLTFSTASLADGGTVKIGSGVDVITVVAAGTATESISGMEKAAAVAVSVVVADATAKAAAIADADVLFFGGAVVADANALVTTGTIAKGVLTFTGAGPSTLTDAFAIADSAANGVGEAVVFQYLGDSYAFVQGDLAADVVVKLVGVTGITNFVEGGVDTFFIV